METHDELRETGTPDLGLALLWIGGRDDLKVSFMSHVLNSLGLIGRGVYS